MVSEAEQIWYQSFTDPDTDALCFDRLRAAVSGVLGDGFDVDVHGMHPADRFQPLTELRCSMQMISNAIAAEGAGYAAFVIGHFQEPGLAQAPISATTSPTAPSDSAPADHSRLRALRPARRLETGDRHGRSS